MNLWVLGVVAVVLVAATIGHIRESIIERREQREWNERVRRARSKSEADELVDLLEAAARK